MIDVSMLEGLEIPDQREHSTPTSVPAPCTCATSLSAAASTCPGPRMWNTVSPAASK
jgi:hypothetical protein